MNLHDRTEAVDLVKAALSGPGHALGLRKYSDDQERDESGRFAGGGGGAGGADKPVSMQEAEAPHFVVAFGRENPSIADRKAALKSRTDEKLRTALRLTEGKHDASTKLFRELITAELDSRGDKNYGAPDKDSVHYKEATRIKASAYEMRSKGMSDIADRYDALANQLFERASRK